MNLRMKKRALFFTTFCFFTSLFAPVSTSYAEEASSGSKYFADGEIKLKWNHSLSVPKALTFTEVDTTALTFEEGGMAIADAEATSLGEAGDTGEVTTFVTVDGSAIGSKALANSSAIADNYFILKNNTYDRMRVNFDWSANWLVSGGIATPLVERSEVGLRLTLMKRRLRYFGRRAVNNMVRDMKGEFETRKGHRGHGRKHKRHLFAKSVVARLPIKGSQFDDRNGTTDGIEISFGPKQAYLFVLHSQAGGLATVSVEGCPDGFWKRRRRIWPINPRTKFHDVFGFGPAEATLWSVMGKSKANSPETMLITNAVAALLNIASTRISYHIDDVDELVGKVNSAFDEGKFDLNGDLEFHNNLGAPYVCHSSLI